MRLAVWSGPRNLSTAMMYAFGNRPDFAVWDEPFYAPYLAATGADHPLAAEIIAAHETDPDRVAALCLGPIPDDKPHFYMKHMPHHMVEGFSRDWSSSCVNIHMIRHPARVVASYGAKRDQMKLQDVGFAQQWELYRAVGGIVIDSADIRQDPEKALSRLCSEIDLPFDQSMLQWPAGPRTRDGVWAKHWYGAVHQSTGFAGADGPLPDLDGEAAILVEAAMPYYEEMKARAL